MRIVDNYGTLVMRCHYTDSLVLATDVVPVVGAIPGTGVVGYMANTDAAIASHKAQVAAFHECEKNCNTCKHLNRAAHKKCQLGFLAGTCTQRATVFKFHPHDPMHMPCWESRHNTPAAHGAQ
jgi:hypothetical protein